jgi:hypothetical protein
MQRFIYLTTLKNSITLLQHMIPLSFKKTKAKQAFALAFLFAAINLHAQLETKINARHTEANALTPLSINETENTSEIVEPYDGSFCFVFTKGIRQAFTDDILKVIENNRKDDEEVTITLSEYCKLRILSRKQVASPGFVPFAKSFVFENNEKY